MRELHAKLAGREIVLVANFKAAQRLSEKVADPFHIARELTLQAEMQSAGLYSYQPKFSFTLKNIEETLWIGLSATDEPPFKRAKLQELIFEGGLAEAEVIAINYVGLIYSPAPSTDEEEMREMMEDDDDDEKESTGN